MDPNGVIYYLSNIFKSNNFQDNPNIYQVVKNRISPDIKDQFQTQFSAEEVVIVISQLKVLSPDYFLSTLLGYCRYISLIFL